uniref:Inhibition of apoptosis protein n=1 Tax=Penaeus vannamei TaxID=6689 RepID=L7STY0_PENVA|nr:inhibitor of apoptosis protein 2 [Penaeus vannamei]AGC24180.1 inhibition of apoptosis protein [Penaeus vannamei]
MALLDDHMGDYRKEQERLDTYKNWSLSWLSPEELAADGLYYLGRNDLCLCAFCRGYFMKWEKGNTPRGEHIRYYPDCPFINNKPVGNIPLVRSHESMNNNASCGNAPEVSNSNSEPDHKGKDANNSGDKEKGLIPKIVNEPDSTIDFRNEENRLKSFENWPLDWLSPDDLAADGFLYLGTDDYCRCVFCNQIIGKWETGDTPRGEHKKHNSQCAFILGKPVGNIPK